MTDSEYRQCDSLFPEGSIPTLRDVVITARPSGSAPRAARTALRLGKTS